MAFKTREEVKMSQSARFDALVLGSGEGGKFVA
jgi:hypothetical protein